MRKVHNMKYKGHEIIRNGNEYDIYENCIYINTAPTLQEAKAIIDRCNEKED